MAQVAAISQQIWDMKYRLKGPGGAAVDKTIEDSWRRVADALAAVEKDPALWAGRFYEALKDFRFLPAGRNAYSPALGSAEQRRNFQARGGAAAAANDGLLQPQFLTPFVNEYPRATPSFVRREGR